MLFFSHRKVVLFAHENQANLNSTDFQENLLPDSVANKGAQITNKIKTKVSQVISKSNGSGATYFHNERINDFPSVPQNPRNNVAQFFFYIMTLNTDLYILFFAYKIITVNFMQTHKTSTAYFVSKNRVLSFKISNIKLKYKLN